MAALLVAALGVGTVHRAKAHRAMRSTDKKRFRLNADGEWLIGCQRFSAAGGSMLDVVFAVKAEQTDGGTVARAGLDEQVPRDLRVGVELHLEQTVGTGARSPGPLGVASGNGRPLGRESRGPDVRQHWATGLGGLCGMVGASLSGRRGREMVVRTT